jgi:glycosyltransferase involved in cell wall biosynthesis
MRHLMSHSPGAFAACTIVRNEAARIAAWIAYHRAIGFDTLVVYDNLSTDETRAVVERMSTVVDVRYVEWRRRDDAFHSAAYTDALECFGGAYDWMFFMDSDEFVQLLDGASIREVMAGYPADVSAVGFNWAIYGSSGLERQPDDLLVIEAFLRHSERGFEPNQFVKSAVRPHRALTCLNSHAFDVTGRYVLGDGTDAEWVAMTGPSAVRESQYGAARLNHYFTKSWAQWVLKVARGYPGEPDRTVAEFHAHDRNEVYDDRILRYAAATRELLTAAGVLAG